MKPYEFYKKGANIKINKDNEKVLTTHGKFGFYDSDELKLDYLNYATPYDPSLNVIRAKQWESAKALVEQSKNTNDSAVVQEIYNTFLNKGDEIVKDLRSDNTQILKTSYMNMNKLINDAKKIQDAKADHAKLKNILSQAQQIFLNLLGEMNQISDDIQRNSYTMSSTIKWDQCKKLVTLLKRYYLPQLNRLLKKKNINIDTDLDFLSQSLATISEANKVYSYMAGEIYPALRLQNLIQTFDDDIKNQIKGLFSMGNIKLETDGETYDLPVDTLVMTEKIYQLNLNSTVQYIEKKKLKSREFDTIGQLYDFLNNLGTKTPKTVYEVKAHIKDNANWQNFLKEAKGLMIQNKFYRNKNYNLFNLDREHTTFSIQDLIGISNSSSDITFKMYAKRLNDFCDWYALSAKRHPPLGNVAAASADKNAINARVYELYFNYLLSQQEVIEKLYGQSIYLFTNTFGAYNLESYFLYMAKQRVGSSIFGESKGMYLLSVANVVDISQINLKLRISMNSTWANKFVKK